MGLLNLFKKKNRIIETETVQSTVIYNSELKFVVLFSYGSKHAQDLAEFINAFGGFVRFAHTAVETELEESENDYSKKTIQITNNKYYVVIAGSPKNTYPYIYRHISLSNVFLEALTKEIYQHLDSSNFQYLIDDAVLDFNKFKYKNIKPKYDEMGGPLVFNFKRRAGTTDIENYVFWDNFKLIMSRLPNVFSAIDIAKMIAIYPRSFGCQHVDILVWDMNGGMPGEDGHPYDWEEELFKLLKEDLFNAIIPNSTPELLQIMNLPIYLREDLDEDDEVVGNVPVEQLDEIFQQQYDRFTQPTAEYTDKYEDIDEPTNEALDREEDDSE